MSESLRNKLSVALMFLGGAFVVIGVQRDEITTVLEKAVMVCLECIGIG